MPMIAVHCNGNLPCAIDCETTGLIPGFHDILQIAVIPLTPMFEPSKDLPYFEMRLKPKRPQNASLQATQINRISLDKAMAHGVDPWDALDRFDEWFKRLNLPERKQIIPVGHNYLAFDRLMIRDWMAGTLIPTNQITGWENYNHYFHWHVRDTMMAALYLNDVSYWQGESVRFPKVTLSQICNVLKVPQGASHDAVSDALAAAAIYRKLMRHLKAVVPDALLQHTENNLDSMLEIPASSGDM